MARILVIDDSPWNVASARFGFGGHEVTVLDNIQDAYTDLKTADLRFDVVLTDLFMSIGFFKGQMTLRRNDYRHSQLLPAGLVFAIAAANQGVPAVICSDTDHHEDWICSLLDLLHFGRSNSHYRIAFVEARAARMRALWKNGVIVPCSGSDLMASPLLIKDWGDVMERSGLFPPSNQ